MIDQQKALEELRLSLALFIGVVLVMVFEPFLMRFVWSVFMAEHVSGFSPPPIFFFGLNMLFWIIRGPIKNNEDTKARLVSLMRVIANNLTAFAITLIASLFL